MSKLLPPELWDKCKFCGWIRKELNQVIGGPVCARQGCPGQHVKAGLPLDK